MRQIATKLILSLTLFIVFGCNEDFLDRPVKGVQTIENYYSNETEANYAVIGAYASLSPEDW